MDRPPDQSSRMSVVSGHLPGHAPTRMSVVSGHTPGGASRGIRMSLVSGHVQGRQNHSKPRASRLVGVGSHGDQHLAINTSSPANSQDDKESGDFRQRVHRLADRLADEHESEMRQLHIENASLRKKCGLPPASPTGSALNGNSSVLQAVCESSQMTEPDPVAATQLGSCLEDQSPKSSDGIEEPDGFGLTGVDENASEPERPDMDENGEDPKSAATQSSPEAEAKADPDPEKSRHSENGEACPRSSDTLDGCLPGCIRDSQDHKGSLKSSSPESDDCTAPAEQNVLPVPSGLGDFIKSASIAVDPEDGSCASARSSMCATEVDFQEGEAHRASQSSEVCSVPESADDELEEFELRAFWREGLRRTEFAQMARTQIAEDVNEKDHLFMMNIEDDDFDGCLKRFIALPSSVHRVLWDFMGMILIGYDIIVIPLEAFNPGSNAFTDTMNWVTLLFWTADMISSFFVGYMDKGVTVLHPYKIAKNYVQTWFFVDIIVVGSDWAFMLVASTQSNVGSLGRLLKILRAIRTLRLVRLLKLKKLMELVNDYIDSEAIAIAVSVGRLVCLLLMSSHFIACTWYLIGDTSRGYGSPNWIESFAANPSTAYRYMTSMHWSLTQFTPASIDVQPQNVAERTFAIIILIFALITFSSFLSKITSSMTQLNAMKEDTMRQFWLLRRFLRERQVPKVLALRIQRYVEYAWQNQNNTVQEAKVKMLSLLSDQLRGELRSATTEPHLNTHPLFQLINTASNVLIQRLSITAIDWRLLADSDSVFFAGETANFMYHVVTGELQYIKGFDPRWVYNGEWICEPVLWTEWVHLGELRSFTECDLINIDATKFGETVRTNPMMQRLVRAYAESYVKKLNNFDARVLSDVEDMMRQGNGDGEDDEMDEMIGDAGFAEAPTLGRATFDPRVSTYRRSQVARRTNVLTGAAGRRVSTQWSSEGTKELDEPGCHSCHSEGEMSSFSRETHRTRVSLEALEQHPENPAAEGRVRKSLTGRKSRGSAVSFLSSRGSTADRKSVQVVPTAPPDDDSPIAAARASLQSSLSKQGTH